MMRRFKQAFMGRLLREKLLLTALVVLAVAIWGSGFLRRLGTAVEESRRVSTELSVQAQWLERRERIESLAKAAIQNLDPAKSLDAVKLTAEVSELASAAGITSNRQIDAARSERTNEFALHSIEFRARRADYANLQAFYFKLAERAPYIGLEQFSLSTVPSRPQELEAVFRITSVEALR
jgi:hypothetical protein